MDNKIAIQLKDEQTAVQETLTLIASIPVTDQAGIDWFNDQARTAARREREIETLRTSITKPQNEALRATNAIFQPVVKAYADLKRALGAKVAEGTRFLEAETKAKLSLATQQYVAGDTALATATMVSAPAEPEHKGTTVRQVWKHEVVSESAVPREYCSPDSHRLSEAITRGAREIPGVRIWAEDQVIVRTK